MAYIGNEPFVSGNFSSSVHNGTGSELTFAMGQSPGTKNAVLVFIDGVRQVPTIYGVSGSDVVFTAGNAPPLGVGNVQILVSGEELGVNVPADDSVTTVKILDDSVTTDKLANAINTTITANTAKVTNATHTGDVTGATALTIAVDAVDIPMLSATGTADATTFLRGDNTWNAAGGGGKTLKVYQAVKTDTTSITSTTFADITGMTITTDAPASTGSRFLVFWAIQIGQPTGIAALTRLERTPSGGSDVYPFIGDAASSRPRAMDYAGIWANGSMRLFAGTYLDSPASAVALTYTMQWCVTGATTIYLNRTDRDNDAATYDARTPSSLIVMEIGS